MATQQVIVSVANDYLGRFSEVVERCRRAGLDVEQALDTVGVVTGAIDPANVAQLEQVEGVAAVEQPRTVRVPEPPPYDSIGL